MAVRRRNGWMLLCGGLVTAVAALDAAVGGALVLIALLSVGPLLAAVRVGPGPTAVVAGYALVAGFLLGIPDMIFAQDSHFVRMGILATICVVSVWLAFLGDRLRSSRDQLAVILEGVADGVTALDRSGRVVFANRAALRAAGAAAPSEMTDAPEGAVARRFEVMDEDGRPVAPDRLPGQRALRGERPDPALLRYRARATGEERWSVVKATPIHDEFGQVDMAISIMEDVTDRLRAERAERFLSNSGKVLSESLDYTTTLRRVADLAVREIADWCAVDVLDERGQLTRVALTTADAGRRQLAEELRVRYPPDVESDVGAYRVAHSGESQLYPEVADELLRRSARDERHLELLRELGLTSAMIVPMVARGRVLGAVTFASAASGRHYDADDLRLAEELALRAGFAVDNARLYSERAYIARALQESLLPPALPDVPGFEVAARFRAAGLGNDVGGDFYDLFETDDRAWAVLIGDVCGKGAAAAGITALARYTLRATAMREERPSVVLATLNDAMIAQLGEERFCTVAFARLERAGTGARLTVASGGHPLPIVVRADGRVETAGRTGTLLGVAAEPDLHDTTVELEPGDAVVLYTDGVTDARAPARILTTGDICALLRGCAGHDAGAIAGRLERAATEPAEGEPDPGEPRDDVAILVVRVCPTT